MLLTRPLTSFLHSNLSPQIHTLLLITPSGKLLASSSTIIPASVLRSQATLASTLWSLYGSHTPSGSLSATIPLDQNGNDAYDSDDAQSKPSSISSDPDVISILIQLDNGVMLMKALKSSLLFIAVGPASSSTPPYRIASSSTLNTSSTLPSSHNLQAQVQALAQLSVTQEKGTSRNGIQGDKSPILRGYAESDAGVESIAGENGKALRKMKRRVEELATWLDEELVGFRLSETL